MRAYKAKVEATEGGAWIRLPVYAMSTHVKLNHIFYSSKDPSSKIRFRDGDGDEFWWQTGNMEQRAVNLDSPVIVKFPVLYFDTDVEGGNEIIVWGEVAE